MVSLMTAHLYVVLGMLYVQATWAINDTNLSLLSFTTGSNPDIECTTYMNYDEKLLFYLNLTKSFFQSLL